MIPIITNKPEPPAMTVHGQHDIVTATAHSAGGGPVLDPAEDPAVCPARVFNPHILVTKNCSVYLEASGGELVVKSRITGYVCNTGDTPLNNVTVVDATLPTPDPNMPNPILSVATLPGQADYPTVNCGEVSPGVLSPSVATYDVVYTPSLLPGDNRLTFSDSVIATGTPPEGAGSTVQSDPATAYCSLCPECPACVSSILGPASLDTKAKKKPHRK